MKVTKIEIQKKNKNRVNLYLDNEFYCGLSLESILKNKVKEGQELTKSQIDFLQINTEREVALSKAINYLAKCQKTRKELIDYLKKKEYEENIISYVVLKLEEYKLINDELYIENFIKYKTKSQGSRKIAFSLSQKGIKKELIDKYLDDFASDSSSIEKVALKYLKNKELDAKTKQKAYRYLVSKGYLSNDIISCLNKFFE